MVRVGAEWVDNIPNNLLFLGDDITCGFYNAMVSAGHEGIFLWGDSDAWETDFRDPSLGGDSHNWIENVHFAYFYNHGWNNGHNFEIYFSSNHSATSSNTSSWRLGSKILKWIAFETCDLLNNLTAEEINNVWVPPWSGVHLVMGFIGNGFDVHPEEGANFGNAIAWGGAIGPAWLGNCWHTDYDDNPVVIAFGATVDEACNRRDNETLSWQYWNISSLGAFAWAAWF